MGPNNPRNCTIRVLGENQLNQAGEITAIILAASAVPPSWPPKIVTNLKYAINGLTKHLKEWENNGWIKVKNAKLFKRVAYLLKTCMAPTTFQWVKGHEGNIGNEESDRLAEEGAEKTDQDGLELDIPINFDLQGAKLASLTQAKAYKGIKKHKLPYSRRTMSRNLQRPETR